MNILAQIALFLAQVAVRILLDRRSKDFVYSIVQEVDLHEIDGPRKMERALRAVRSNDRMKELPDLVKTMAIEAAVDEIHKRVKK
jgi:hypothetical protein